MTATVYVVPSRAEGKPLAEQFAAWARHGLLSPTIWVDASAVPQPGERAPAVRGSVIDGTGEREVEVIAELALRRHVLIRVVAVRLVAATPDGEATFHGDAFVDLLEPRLPATTRLFRASLVIPASGVLGIPATILAAGWHANLVVSPEDRISDGLVARSVTSDDDGCYVGHATLASSVVGGAWIGASVGPFDELAASASGRNDAIPRVIRCFARVLEGGSEIDDISRNLLRSGSEWPVPYDGEEPVADVARSAGDLITEVADSCRTLADSAVVYRNPPPLEVPTREPLHAWEAFRRLFRFIGERLRRAPFAFATRVRVRLTDRAIRFATDWTVGDGSRYEIVLAGRSSARDPSPALGARDVAAAADGLRSLIATKTSYVTPATPDLWQGLRAAAFGLIDAGSMPPGVAEPNAAGVRQVVLDPRLVGPSLEDGRFVVAGEHLTDGDGAVEIGPCDAFLARRIRRLLSERRASVDAPGSAADADGSARSVSAVDHIVTALDGWARERSGCFLWRVADGLARELESAQADLLSAIGATRAKPDGADNSELAREWKRCRRRWVLFGVMLLLGVGAGVVLGVVGSALVGALVGLVGIGVWATGSLLAWVRYQRAEFRVINQAEEAISAYNKAVDDVDHISAEVVRLADLYDALMRWSEVIGRFVHNPWGDETPSGPPITSVDPPGSPLALRVAHGETDDRHLQPLVAEVRRQVYRVGWLTRNFADFADESLERFRSSHGLVRSVDPDDDRPRSSPSLDHLLRELRDPRYGDLVRPRVRSEIARQCMVHPASDLYSRATVVGETGESEIVDVDDFVDELLPVDGVAGPFVGDIWSDEAHVQGRRKVERTVVAAPPEVVRRAHPAVITVTTDGADTGERLQWTVLRGDASAECTVGDLAILGSAQHPVDSPTTPVVPPDDRD